MKKNNSTMKLKHIMIVENEANWRQVYSDILQADGYYVDTASSIQDAISKLNTVHFDLAIIDLRLMDEYIFGYQGLNIILVAKEKGIKTLVCTGFGKPELKKIVLDQFGADEYLEKEPSFNVKRFRYTIKRLLVE